MSDRIVLHRIAIYAYHGVLAEEERIGQRFYVSLDCRLDLREVGRTDTLHTGVSYADLAQVATDVATRRRFRTIEAVAETIAGELLSKFPPLDAVTVTVDKPGAPVPAILDGISVEITRRRAD
ncbi:dihydroneopterin aldolase [Enterovirga aerilata]|uniref:7,8-dihydroneopterin aldolase n=1 Tax=Enterovirga aerilata TaxID=2730920 RepID=A0A849I2A1_9HYPH|nr:dihydroneopterin aldolase [Enterovirga sp. DB1703]NNM71478.1 dihydroneopterin aldolase [Enterovirga sp. DB1703]